MARAAIVLVLFVGALALRASSPAHGVPKRPAPRAGLTFDASVDAPSRALIETAIASARPEARALLDRVAGYTDVSVGIPAGHALGTTQRVRDRYRVVLDLGTTQRSTGPRGVTRLVLHELGHVVDLELLADDLRTQLDAEIPAGVPCPAGTRLGSCAPRAERFAETFAKWAMGNDLGANLFIGYAVPPPSVGFDAWAAPLVALPEN